MGLSPELEGPDAISRQIVSALSYIAGAQLLPWKIAWWGKTPTHVVIRIVRSEVFCVKLKET